MSTYKLYATKSKSKRTEKIAAKKFSLRPCNTDYLLVFTDKELKKPFVEIPPETELTEQEQAFVARSKAIINKRHIDEHQEEYAEALNDFLNSLEAELKAEKKKLKPKKKVAVDETGDRE